MTEMTRERTDPATLWIGNALSALEYMCLKSLVVNGMRPVLYSYEAVKNVPPGVRCKDAEKILPRSRIFKNKERDSFAPFADVFRYQMLRETKFYWVDADVLALKKFDFRNDYFLAWHPPVVASGVLSLPRESSVLEDLIAACEKPNVELPWLRATARASLQDQADKNGGVLPELLPYKALGPIALTWLLEKHGESHHVLPQQSHYGLWPREILKKYRRILPNLDIESAYSIHLFGSVQHRKIRERALEKIPPKSVLGYFAAKYEVDPVLYPEGWGNAELFGSVSRMPTTMVRPRGQKRKIVFLHRAAHQKSGSKLMRCDQLCALAKRTLGDRFEFEVVCFPGRGRDRKQGLTIESLRGAVVILLKRVHAVLERDKLEMLKDCADKIMLDYVDAEVDATAIQLADFHIATSKPAADKLKSDILKIDEEARPKIVVLTHHSDPRIRYRNRGNDDTLSACYLGLPKNTVLPPEIETELLVPSLAGEQEFVSALKYTEYCNLHYCIRPKSARWRNNKPFTKGFNAAAAGANVLVDRQNKEAEYFLGKDYPFFIAEPTKEQILEGYKLVKESVGTSDWKFALDTMDELRHRSSPVTVVNELGQILDVVLD